MAHRLPPAGISTTPTKVFRFYEVRECPEKAMAASRDLGSRQQPQYQTCPVLKCCCRKVKPPNCCDALKAIQKCAHLLPPAGMASRKSDVFRFNMVHESEGKRGSKTETCSCCCKCVPAEPRHLIRPKPPPPEKTVCCCEVTCKCPLRICCECRKVKRPERRPRPTTPEPVMLCCTKLAADESSEICQSRPPPQQIVVCCDDGAQDEPSPEDEQKRASLHCPSDVYNLEEELPLPPTKNNWPAEGQTPTVPDHRKRLGPETSWLESQLKTGYYPRLPRILYPPSTEKKPVMDRGRSFALTPSKMLR